MALAFESYFMLCWAWGNDCSFTCCSMTWKPLDMQHLLIRPEHMTQLVVTAKIVSQLDALCIYISLLLPKWLYSHTSIKVGSLGRTCREIPFCVKGITTPLGMQSEYKFSWLMQTVQVEPHLDVCVTVSTIILHIT